MERVSLGRSGLTSSRFGIGSATFGHAADEREAFRILDRAYASGIRFVDTADGYPQVPGKLGLSESIIGRWLSMRAHSDVVVATKVNYPMGDRPNDRGLGRTHILQAVEASLTRLGVEAIDLYQAHQADPAVPIDETMDALSRTIDQGKVRYTGVCNWPAWQVVQAQWIAEARGCTRLTTIQTRYNLVSRAAEEQLFPMAEALGLGVVAFNPLAAGLLAGRYLSGHAPEPGSRFDDSGETYDGRSVAAGNRHRYLNGQTLAKSGAFIAFCDEHGYSPVTTAVAWALARSAVSVVLLGARSAAQLDESLAAPTMSLSTSELQELDAIGSHDG